MKTDTSRTNAFTGRHMLLIMLAFFGVIIAVNVTMAVLAHTSWTGFVVRNSYVAGLEFNRKAGEARKQAELGWTPELTVAEGVLRYALADAQGRPVRLWSGSVTLRRPVSDADDATVALTPLGGALEGAIPAADGAWIVEMTVEAGLETAWRETRRIFVRDGAIR